jgi:8-amino-7-oxononanoate synthase
LKRDGGTHVVNVIMKEGHLNSTKMDPCIQESISSPAVGFEEQRIIPALQRRNHIGSLRRLRPFHLPNSIDFSSNDYLGLSGDPKQHKKVEETYESLLDNKLLGSTGSRLLTGDSQYAQTLEMRLAKWHRRPAALLCNSGYDANLSVMSCVTLDTVVIMDELSHNSLQMGVKLSKDCDVDSFLHNDLKDLRGLLEHYHEKESTKRKPILVVVESVYSMDGDIAPLKEILDLSLEYQACVIVDEAHGMGVFGEHGMGVLERDSLEQHPALLCSIHTFGKAAGCHGAVICGSQSIKDYLLNYGRPIIYSTSLPTHSLVTIACSYQTMAGPVGRQLRCIVKERIQMFRSSMTDIMKQTRGGISLVDSVSPIQALIVPGNSACVAYCEKVWEKSHHSIRLYPIRSPTVPTGQERVRIIIHAHNTPSQITLLLRVLLVSMQDLGYLASQQSKL